MDDFDNFYNKRDDHENKPLDGEVEGAPKTSGGKDKPTTEKVDGEYSFVKPKADEQTRVIFQQVSSNGGSNGSNGSNGANGDGNGDDNVKKYKRRSIIATTIAAVLIVAFIVNIFCLVFLKSDIASAFADKMSSQAQSEYSSAIKSALDDTDIVDDVKSAAASEAADIISTPIGEYCAEKCLASTVIMNCSYSGGSSTATGYLINEGTTRYVLTNAHVVTYEKTVSSGIWGGSQTTTNEVYSTIYCTFEGDSTKYSLTVVDYDSDVDLAVCKFKTTQPDNTTHPAIKISTAALKYGEEVALIGNPQGIGLAVSVGCASIPTLTVSSWGSATFVMTDAAVNNGNSGGPMLNKSGYCVGIVESKLVSTSIDNMGFAVSASTIVSYLNSKSIPYVLAPTI